MYGLALATKEWGAITIEDLRPIEWREGAFEHLSINEDDKSIIKALVTASTMQSDDSKTRLTDVIEGKGAHLFCAWFDRSHSIRRRYCDLAARSPRHGQNLGALAALTSSLTQPRLRAYRPVRLISYQLNQLSVSPRTAESTAELLKRPLYPLTAGDLSESAHQLEESLRDIFETSANWQAITLLDEADVFLEARSRHVRFTIRPGKRKTDNERRKFIAIPSSRSSCVC